MSLQSSFKGNLLFAISVGFGTLLVAEFGLRIFGFSPGQFQYNKWITPVEKLEAVNGFAADANGVFKVDTFVTRAISSDCAADPTILENVGGDYCGLNNVVPEVAVLYENHLNPVEKSGEYWQRLEELSKNGCKNCSDSLFLSYASNPVNVDGFYSIPFDTSCHEGKRLLLLGDSFTWGHSTSNKTLSFANILLSRGFQVYNTGVSGADLPQYLHVLRTYFSNLEPDAVVLNLFMGNDIMDYERRPLPYVPVHFSTNAGNLLSFQGDTQLLDMHQAYNNIMRNMVVKGSGVFAKIAINTVIGAYAWAVAARFGFVSQQFYQYPDSPSIPESRETLVSIRAFCDSVDVPLIVSIIPTIENGSLVGAESNPKVFENITFHQPEMNLDLYRVDDGHFNDEGHLFYANYLEQLLEGKLREN